MAGYPICGYAAAHAPAPTYFELRRIPRVNIEFEVRRDGGSPTLVIARQSRQQLDVRQVEHVPRLLALWGAFMSARQQVVSQLEHPLILTLKHPIPHA